MRRLDVPRTAIRSMVCCEEVDRSDEGSVERLFGAMSRERDISRSTRKVTRVGGQLCNFL